MNLRVAIAIVFGFLLLDPGAQSQEAVTDPELATETFEVSLDFFDALEEKRRVIYEAQNPDRLFGLEDPASLRPDPALSWSFMEPFGVTFGPGSYAMWNPETGILEVTNTPKQLKIVGEVVASIPRLTEAEEKKLVSSIIRIPQAKAEVLPTPRLDTMQKRASAMRIPAFQIEKTNLRDALDFLHTKTVEFDTTEVDENQKGFHFILDAGFAYQFPDGALEKPITLNLTDVSLVEVLRRLVEPLGCKFRVEAYAIIVNPESLPDPVLQTIAYTLPPSIFQRFISKNNENHFPDPFADPPGEAEKNQKAWTPQQAFEHASVTFRSGAGARYDEESGRIVVTNTEAQLKLVEACLRSLDEGKFIFNHDSHFHSKTPQ